MASLDFQIQSEKKESESVTRARAGTFRTAHGIVETPTFMAVGTQATVKGQSVDALKEAGCTVLLANTYHLLLRPGPEVFRKLGGIHSFMRWDGPVLTDSGGFQIFSLPRSRRIDEEGALFQSYVDGKSYLLSPEISIGMQKAIGSDIMMVLDKCVPSGVNIEEARSAVELTHRWARRSLAARGNSEQALFGIVQGACFEDLRRQSAEFLTGLPFDGFAIGGLAVGETKSKREAIVEGTAQLLPAHLPRYLMGVGTPSDLLEAVHRGVDMFDCIIPSQIAKRGGAYTSVGRLQLRRDIYKFSEEKLDPDCECPTCRRYSRAYLHHLYKCEEVLGWSLLTSHNLAFYHRLMREMRANILAGTFGNYLPAKREALARTDNLLPTKSVSEFRSRIDVLGDYEVHASSSGFFSIRQRGSGEIMHSVVEPLVEARRLYVEQSGLEERLRDADAEPLVIWDVGLGAATNAMAAIFCSESLDHPRPLRIFSFECDLHPLLLALKFPSRFPHLRHPAPHTLLAETVWENEGARIRWDLVEGDFNEKIETTPAPDLIFYDPFSQKTDTALWTPEIFLRLFRHCEGKSAQLFTYSASTSVRASLLWAGFSVGAGVSTGPKSETTIASTSGRGGPFLGPQWLDRWTRSDAKFPPKLKKEDRPLFARRVQNHPQFGFSRRGESGSLGAGDGAPDIG